MIISNYYHYIIMGIISFLKEILRSKPSETAEQGAISVDKTTEEAQMPEIHSVWDYLKTNENTQVFHLSKVIGFDEWVSMEEIRRRILEIFGAEYKNSRSLYAYIKALTDLGLFETSNIGGTRKWRKKELLIKVLSKKKKKELEEAGEELESMEAEVAE